MRWDQKRSKYIHLKRLLPVLFLLFVCIFYLNKNAAAQEHAAIKAKVDTAEEIVIVCSFPSIEAEFSGGDSAWQRFVTRHLVYPKDAIKKKIQGIITVKFLVRKDGTVSDVTALCGPQELKQSAIAVVVKSRLWHPAILKGRYVDECKQVDIEFKLQPEYCRWPPAFSYISNHVAHPAQYCQIHS